MTQVIARPRSQSMRRSRELLPLTYCQSRSMASALRVEQEPFPVKCRVRRSGRIMLTSRQMRKHAAHLYQCARAAGTKASAGLAKVLAQPEKVTWPAKRAD